MGIPAYNGDIGGTGTIPGDFAILRHPDGSFALFDANDQLIDGVLVQDVGQDPVKVAATAYTERGQRFYVKLPARCEALKHAPALIEERLRTFAVRWAESHNADPQT